MKFGKYKEIGFYWFPPKKERKFKLTLNHEYDGELSHILCLWFVNIWYSRPATYKDMGWPS